jgi:hypothetical protein
MVEICLVRILVDTLTLSTLLAIEILLQRHKLDPQTVSSGFFCRDFPYVNQRKARREAVSELELYLIIFLLPVSLIVATELIRACRQGRARIVYELELGRRLRVGECLGNLYNILGVFLLGAVSTDILTNVGKNTMARMRPCFLEMCRPEIDVAAFCGAEATYVHLADLRCTRAPREYSDSMKSFPSGHSSMSFYPMVGLILNVFRSLQNG